MNTSFSQRLCGGLILFGLAGFVPDLKAQEFEFVVIGDTRPRFESENFQLFAGLITKINALKPALVINLGDLIYGYGPLSKERQWDKYQRVVQAFEVPYYQVPGNHDTHSREARRIYTRRFGQGYRSFDYGNCHFVLLDNTEAQRWGYMSPTQVDWLKADLKATQGRAAFVFMHFPVWEPERVVENRFRMWSETLHPLFKASNVKAVFAGHYHAYGPSREFDGIRYFITGGGGAELRPEYKKSGGEHHFMRVKVSGQNFDVRVVTERGEVSDAEADVMGGLQFAEKHSSRIGIDRGTQDLQAGVTFSLSLNNPYDAPLTGKAEWVGDASAFETRPASVSLEIPPGQTQEKEFTLKALKQTTTLSSLPRLEFNVTAAGHRYRFHRDVLFIRKVATPYIANGARPGGELEERLPVTTLGAGSGAEVQIATGHNEQYLHLALTLPKVKPSQDYEDEDTPADDLQIGLARRLSRTDFTGDFLRLGFSAQSSQALDRTPGHRPGVMVPGVKCATRTTDERAHYQIEIPFRILRHPKADGLVMDVSFPAPESENAPGAEPRVNTFSYRVRYGNDSLFPVYFVELELEQKK